jgi:ribosomal protein L11 methyltransferase
MPYLRRVYRLPAELEEILVADLWLAGTLGVSTETEPDGRLRLTAYFTAPAAGLAGERPASPEGAAAPGPAPRRVECLVEDELPEADWMAEYRRRTRPFTLGRALVVDPREPETPEGAAGVDGEEGRALPPGRRLLRLPARTAFGTGSHESTALAIELLEEAELTGRAVLDVGTGTGVLAFAALTWGAARVVGFDADPAAAFQARSNSRLNALYPRLFAGRPAALAPRPGFDLVVVNVVPEQILPEIADLLAALRPGGSLILSGLLAERVTEALALLATLGFAEAGRRQAGEWVALLLALPPPASSAQPPSAPEPRRRSSPPEPPRRSSPPLQSSPHTRSSPPPRSTP